MNSRQSVKELITLTGEINGVFAGTHYEKLGKRMRKYVGALAQAFNDHEQPDFEVFVEDQRALLEELLNTQAMIRVQMDQQRPMTRDEVLDYLKIPIEKLHYLQQHRAFPQPYRLGATEFRYRKHEIDTWLYQYPEGPAAGRKPTPIEDRESAEARQDRVATGRNVVRMKSR